MTTIPDRADLRRDQILTAAERIFAAKGYHTAGIADIAAELGIGHGTFYRYFKSKQDIAHHLVERAVARFLDVALAEDPAASDTLDEYRAQVGRILDGILALADSHRTLVRFMLEQWVSVDPVKLDEMKEAQVAYTVRFLDNGLAKRFLRPDLDVKTTAQMLVALVFEGTRRALASPDPAQRQRWRDAGLALMFDGLRARPDI